MKQHQIKNKEKSSYKIILITTLFAACLLAMTALLIKPASAVHGTECITGEDISCGVWWSRATADGHRAELICSTTFPNQCKIPFFLHSSLDNIKGTLTFAQIGNEAFTAADYLGTATANIGLLSQALTSTWDNKISGTLLSDAMNARYVNVLKHCPQAFCIGGNDKHLLRAEIQVNTSQSSSFKPFEATEVCTNGNPTQKDLDKTFKHEFTHLMGFAHSSTSGSIVYAGGYQCGVGHVYNSHDRTSVQQKYP